MGAGGVPALGVREQLHELRLVVSALDRLRAVPRRAELVRVPGRVVPGPAEADGTAAWPAELGGWGGLGARLGPAVRAGVRGGRPRKLYLPGHPRLEIDHAVLSVDRGGGVPLDSINA